MRIDFELLGVIAILLGCTGFIFIGLGCWEGFFIPLGIIAIVISFGLLFYIATHKE